MIMKNTYFDLLSIETKMYECLKEVVDIAHKIDDGRDDDYIAGIMHQGDFMMDILKNDGLDLYVPMKYYVEADELVRNGGFSFRFRDGIEKILDFVFLKCSVYDIFKDYAEQVNHSLGVSYVK